MIKTDQFRKRLKIEINNEPYVMLDVDFVRPGKGQGFVRTKLKNLMTGSTTERTFKSNETAKPATVNDYDMQFLYNDGDGYTFMNMETYDQVSIMEDVLADAVNYLYENMEVNVSFYNDMPISVEVPNFVEMEITDCEPGIKGNSATNTLKPAVVSSGYRLNVPLFIDQNEWIRIDTRDGSYVERCKRPEGR
ncbi:elongation factor P [Acanthopleuribacter pedis]|uniref:Elongation factor P n=1 Tax=Acanthopleuribacter pedis TaxID=442870 RepID=A0A8J7U735_9BACT|nr:elongation factor P [Acanthopleuribacter pedis]MBO1321006.1 elongation factor P [Acanthopleuribacter pedis]